MTASDHIEHLLRQHIGLEPQSIGPAAVAAVVRLRMRHLGVDSTERYFERVSASPVELDRLIEEIIVPETWFFRDRVAFTTLARWVLEDWLPVNPGKTLRLLSAPCSTGEEAYSLAICLLEAGLATDRIVIEGVDISTRSLDCARQAVFGRRSFRGADLEFRGRHFAPVAEGWRLHPDIRGLVQFRQGNLLDPDLVSRHAVQDIILCRNLLIYLDEPAQRRLMSMLRDLLGPDGLLFVGHAESFIFRNFGFRSAGRETSFVFRSPGATPRKPEHRPPTRRRPALSLPASVLRRPPRDAGPRLEASAFVAPRAKLAATLAVIEDDLAAARRLADAGRLEEAAKHCHHQLAVQGPSDQLFYLLGLISDAAGRSAEAAGFYRKTLYLTPEHPEALQQLALLQERLGEMASARQLRERARRVRERIKT